MDFGNNLHNQWFDHIINLDKEGTIEQGKIYAKDGSVFDLKINNNVITAKVKINQYKVHDVKIEFDELSHSQINDFEKEISKNPIHILDLFNGIDYYKILDKLFLNNLSDFKTSCSCKSDDKFCLEVSALLWVLKYEVKFDSSLIFTFRGVDLSKFKYFKPLEMNNVDDIFLLEDDFKINDAVIDFTDVKPLFDINEYYLKNQPNFYNDKIFDFKFYLFRFLKSASKLTEESYSGYKDYITLGNTFQFFDNREKNVDSDSKFKNKWSNPHLWNSFNFDVNESYEIIDSPFNTKHFKHAFFAFLKELEYSNIEQYCENIQFCFMLLKFTSKLISNGAIIPEFISLNDDNYMIRWIPALYDDDIVQICEKLYYDCPEDLITFNGKVISKKSQVLTVISFIISGYFRYFINEKLPNEFKQIKNDFYFNLFFRKAQSFKHASVENKQFNINNWLSMFKFKQSNYECIISIKEDSNDFSMHIKVNDYNLLTFNVIEIVKDILDVCDVKFDSKLNAKLKLRDFDLFYHKLMPIFKLMGIEVELPDSIKSDAIKLVLDVYSKKSYLTLDDLDNFDWKVAIGDDSYTINEFKKLSKQYGSLVKLDNGYVILEKEDAVFLDSRINNLPKDLNRHELIQVLLAGQFDELEVDINNKLKALMRNIKEIKKANIPDSLTGKLRYYQEKGYSWLVQNIKTGFGSILADDMGLGKTLQVLTTVLHLKESDLLTDGKVLVIAPTSLLSNWQKEIEKFTPTLTSFIYHGQGRKFPDENVDILITSYGIVRRDIKLFNEKSWFLIIVDEAQNIKNPSSKQTRAIKSLNSNHRIALSGTPIENRLSEYWSIFDFTNNGYLSSLGSFKRNYMNPIENYGDGESLDNFKKITKPFILRRLKSDKDIVKDLPDKVVNDVYCNLTEKQAVMYDESLNQLLRDLSESEGINRKGIVLKLITALKQICNHPAQFTKSNTMQINESGKMEVLINILENILDSGEKVLIFTQYVKMGEIIQELVSKHFDEEVMFLHGSLNRKNRDEMINKFQNEDNCKIFVISLKAGGIGLNLTAASNVIHYDLWWNPAVENQATDRAYRIGQKDNVMVYRFVTVGTFEEKINQMIKDKIQLAELTIDTNETFITEMNNEELKEMLELRNN